MFLAFSSISVAMDRRVPAKERKRRTAVSRIRRDRPISPPKLDEIWSGTEIAADRATALANGHCFKGCNISYMITMTEYTKVVDLITPMIPGGWFEGPLEITVDDDEIVIVGTLAVSGPGEGEPVAFREATRAARMEIADRVQPATGRSVAWGATTGGTTTVFTSLGIPVMTRLRINEREVLDTLLAAGVAKSRSEALAWCVRFVGQKEATWLHELRTSIESVSRVRAEGPRLA